MCVVLSRQGHRPAFDEVTGWMAMLLWQLLPSAVVAC